MGIKTKYYNKKSLFVLLLVFCVTILLTSKQASAAPKYCPEITSISSHNGSITVNWSKTENPADTYVEVYVVGAGSDGEAKSVIKKADESDRTTTVNNVAPDRVPYGTEVEVRIRATFKYSDATKFTEPKTVVVRSGKGGGWNRGSAQSMKYNAWYTGETSGLADEFPPTTYNWYKFKTSSRTDSKYRLTVNCTNSISGFQADADIFDQNDYSIAFSFGESSEPGCQSGSYSDTIKLSPNKEYCVGVSGMHDGYHPMAGVEYKVKIEEIIANPGKVSISSFCSYGRKATVQFKKINNASGYQVAFKKRGGSWKYSNTTSLYKSFSNLKYKKTYYSKVRAYSIISGKKIYGNWSSTRKVTIKKPIKTSFICLKGNKVYKSFDVNNDGKKDKVKIKKTHHSADGSNSIKIYVNGRQVIKTGKRKGINAYIFAQGKKAIIITQTFYLGGASDMKSYSYYSRKYHGKKLEIPGCYYHSVRKSGNRLVVEAQPKFGSWTNTFERFNRMPFSSQQEYVLKSGKLRKVSKYPSLKKNTWFPRETISTTYFFAWESFRAANTLSTINNKVGIKVNVGDTVLFKSMVYKNGYYYYKIEVNGNTGWIKDSDAIAFGNDMS